MVIPNLKFSEMGGGYSGINFGHPKSEVFRNGGVFRSKLWSSQIWSFLKWGGGPSGLQFQKGAFWKIWTKIYCAARNLLVHHSSLSHTTYVETNNLLQWIQKIRSRLEAMHKFPMVQHALKVSNTFGFVVLKLIRLDHSLQKNKIPTEMVMTGVITIRPKSHLWAVDKEKLSVTFSHVWLILVEFSKFY